MMRVFFSFIVPIPHEWVKFMTNMYHLAIFVLV